MRNRIRLFFNDTFRVPLPERHRFPMEKYRMTRKRLQQLRESSMDFVQSPLATVEELETTHSKDYIRRFIDGDMSKDELRRVGFPWSPALVDRTLTSVGGTVAAMRHVLDPSSDSAITGHLAGGTHHAFYDRGEGFCVFNDIAVAANLALLEYQSVKKVLVVDLDVHQGNGTAVLFQNDPRVFTLSIHCKRNLFSKREDSDLDVDLDAACGDQIYMDALQDCLPDVWESVRPDLVFYQAGVDVLASDALGGLSLTREGASSRNRFVYDLALSRGCPLVVTMGGGYPKNLQVNSHPFLDLVEGHADIFRDALAAVVSHAAKMD